MTRRKTTGATIQRLADATTADGLKHFRKRSTMGRPTLGRVARQTVTMRIDPDVLRKLRTRAAKIGIGYQQLMHQLLEQGIGGAK